jgi:thioredoxin reductase/SAM-dependent methyltransferase
MDHHPHSQLWDVVVVGGGAAGLAAALQLARARRSVVVVDAGEPRNAPAAHMHAYLGHDGLPPAEFLAIARKEVLGYGAQIVRGTATGVTGSVADGFAVAVRSGPALTGRRVLLATGLVDVLPDIPGLADQWGRGVIHCPYCHGWEIRDQRVVLLATSPLTAHQALLFRQLTDRVTVVLHDPEAVSHADRRRLGARGVRFTDGRVAEVMYEEGAADPGALRGVRLADGRVLEADAVVVAPRFVARTELLAGLGIEPVPAPMGAGEMIPTDGRGATPVAGLYAAGNAADVSSQVLGAAAEGSRVGAAINADLAGEDADLALARPGDTAADWDQRYAATDRWWSGRPNGALVAEAGPLEPGTALDVGSGEGADAIWLAGRGWRVTGLDISQVALDRAQKAADDAGVQVEWMQADLGGEHREPGQYDLVTVHYPALPLAADDRAIRALLGAVAPNGRLLVVGHAFDGHGHGHGHAHKGNAPSGFRPEDYVQPGDVARRLGAGWVVEVHETRPRVTPPGYDGPHVDDVVLHARRTR